jgi:hypothetical protein
MKIVVGTSLPAYKLEPGGYGLSWLTNAGAIAGSVPDALVVHFAALQLDGRGRAPFQELFDRLDALAAAGVRVGVWSYTLDTGTETIGSSERFAHICVGRNAIAEFAHRFAADWIYYTDADCAAPADVLPRLLEVGHPVVGAHVPTFCLDGPRVDRPGMDLRRHWNTAGSLLVARDAFRRVPWRYDAFAGESEDVSTQHELERLGWPTLVRHDVIVDHFPQHVRPLEDRGHDLTFHRGS